MTTTDPRTTAGEPGGPGAAGDSGDASGLSVVALSQGQLVRRRFFRHRGALAGMAVLLFVIVLAFSSIGFAGIPGWWHYSFTQPTPIENGGRPTLDVVPWLDGDGLAWGDHPFGQDNIGVDYFALTMRGAQRSLIIAFMVGVVATIIGTLIGALAGYFRGWADSLLMRVTDVFITIPVIVIGAVLGRRFGALPIALFGAILGVLLWTSLARLVRGSFLSLREKEFVEAARAMGASSSRIIFKHILPNSLGVIIVAATLVIAVAILTESALSYLGLGVRAPETSLGLLISDYESAFTTRPWLFWWPGLFIVLIALSVNFIGDGLRDAFDPRQARVRS
ncbi:peptide/nickel transport system permease protein [Quadrisphaera granulorum]|uniref:Oligopeptide transport system permease protein OppC n=1 Tax=Quadrisphaera granulorum TaxID=317664 RepID=A0A316AFM8_9ACTN|nr:ABC transporter permease [Quadrisphaera granulorum]PWJ56159.1 peptide/nickel transport system permease protein [Quadrisphaera granulorum]SZE94793.1 peptide/nickel transport system permease protein [Quadrisphaera granulorum]